jgi:hypothetical protein
VKVGEDVIQGTQVEGVRSAVAILITALPICYASPLALDHLFNQEQREEVVLMGLQGLLQDTQVNELVNKTSGGLKLLGHHDTVVYETGCARFGNCLKAIPHHLLGG